MKVILSMAVSVNGFIASDKGDEDFLSHTNWIQFIKLANKIGNNIWGRKTYEEVKGWDKQYFKDLERIDKVVISEDVDLKLDPGFHWVKSPQEALKYLEGKGFRTALVTGGSNTYSNFLKEGLVDEIVLDVEPAIAGQGVPAFAPRDFMIRLELLSTEKLNDGIIELRYKVKK